MTVANSVFTIFQVISATDQFERGPRKGTSSPSLGEEKTRYNVNKLEPQVKKQSQNEGFAQDASSSPAVRTGLRAPTRPSALGLLTIVFSE